MVFLLLLSVILNAAPAQAGADTADVIGAAGRLGYETGTKGAVTNRRVADQLYQQALADEKQAWKSFPPNVGLLAKALQESKDAKAADDQAKEHARAALHSSNTGAHSGDFINQRYGMVEESKLKELSNTSSPYMPQVEKALGGYGLKLSSDKMHLQTPFGKFSVNPDDSALLKMASAMATKLGYSAADVAKGQQEAIKARDAIARQAVAGLEKEAQPKAGAAADGGRNVASEEGKFPGNKKDEDKAIGAKAGAEAVKNFESASTVKPLSEAEQEVLDKRKALGKELGMGDDVDPLGRKTQDIFQMIHTRYQSLNSQGIFYGQ